jgi:hypothetical protein
MLLGTFFNSKMANFSHKKKITTPSANNPQLQLLTKAVHYQTMTQYIHSGKAEKFTVTGKISSAEPTEA